MGRFLSDKYIFVENKQWMFNKKTSNPTTNLGSFETIVFGILLYPIHLQLEMEIVVYCEHSKLCRRIYSGFVLSEYVSDIYGYRGLIIPSEDRVRKMYLTSLNESNHKEYGCWIVNPYYIVLFVICITMYKYL